MLFQSTHSLRSATGIIPVKREGQEVSIHALLAECDGFNCLEMEARTGFNPRTPCGVRHGGPWPTPSKIKFQSTHSLRSATPPTSTKTISYPVSIHALLAECDSLCHNIARLFPGFNPRTPCGVRPYNLHNFLMLGTVSIHALLAECDKGSRRNGRSKKVSIHALLAECDVAHPLLDR